MCVLACAGFAACSDASGVMLEDSPGDLQALGQSLVTGYFDTVSTGTIEEIEQLYDPEFQTVLQTGPWDYDRTIDHYQQAIANDAQPSNVHLSDFHTTQPDEDRIIVTFQANAPEFGQDAITAWRLAVFARTGKGILGGWQAIAYSNQTDRPSGE